MMTIQQRQWDRQRQLQTLAVTLAKKQRLVIIKSLRLLSNTGALNAVELHKVWEMILQQEACKDLSWS
jgi:hypothetical protein